MDSGVGLVFAGMLIGAFLMFLGMQKSVRSYIGNLISKKPAPQKPVESVKTAEVPKPTLDFVFCSNCGNKVKRGTNFCSKCGGKI